MCMFCKEELLSKLKNLKRYEFTSAGKELITSAKTLEEIEHIEERMNVLEKELFQNNYDFEDEF